MSLSTERQNLDYLHVQYQSFMGLGLDIGVLRRDRLITSFWKLMFYTTCVTFMQYGFITFVIHSITNIDNITSSLSMFNQGVLLMFKGTMIIYKGDKMLNLIWKLNKLAKDANPEENEKWISQNRRGELITKAYLYACRICITCVAIIPWIFVVYEYMKGWDMHLELPFEMEFPYDDGGWPASLVNYVLTMFHIRGLANTSIGIDTLFAWYVHAISGHFRILCNKIKKAATKIDLYDNHGDFRKDIGEFVRYHDQVLKFVDDLNLLYGPMAWAEITMSCLQLCFLLYSLVNTPNFASIPFNFVASASVTIQLMIYCFGGEKLKNENDMLCEDIYMDMPWDKMYPSEKKLILMPIIRAQKEAILKGLFFHLNRSLLVFIFKNAFSFITLLGAMKE
ncbi:odorant receptor 45a-like [Haematobia irritans]|uniref:odorant receptor 45a-like n=1 Tax=Haematobia irritans TaxID=7368 RepID=UPI003F5023D1